MSSFFATVWRISVFGGVAVSDVWPVSPVDSTGTVIRVAASGWKADARLGSGSGRLCRSTQPPTSRRLHSLPASSPLLRRSSCW